MGKRKETKKGCAQAEKKTAKNGSDQPEKRTAKQTYSSDRLYPVWRFDKLDRGGKFAFDLNREDFEHKHFLDKMISYSRLSWQEIKRQTHDKSGKSKNHFIPADELSKEAQERIKILHLEEYSDSIFSFAFLNKLRIFGYRENEYFYVLWYDPNHEIYPVEK